MTARRKGRINPRERTGPGLGLSRLENKAAAAAPICKKTLDRMDSVINKTNDRFRQ
jgi:hypothetical protein